MRQRQQGFSLVEILIGLVLGMLAVVLVLQAFGRSNAATRAAASSDDAQLNAMMALHILGREVRQSGLNLSSLNLLGCSLSFKPSSANSVVSLTVGPVQINPEQVAAGDSHTDTLLLLSGNYAGPPEGDTVSSASASAATVSTAAAFEVGNYLVLAAGSPTTPCQLALYQVTGKNGTALTLSDLSGGVTSTSTERAYNLGSLPRLRAYAIRNGTLTECDYLNYDCSNSAYTADPAIWVPVAPQVVSLRAQLAYAEDVSDFTKRLPSKYIQSTADFVTCNWAGVVGLRFAVVGRGLLNTRPTYDPKDPSKVVYATDESPSWAGTSDGAWPDDLPMDPEAPVDLSGLTDWKNFRYRLMETAMPLRNILWQGATTCS